jgi:succinoglycan biosynthesis transport protein ExoP
VQKMDAAAIAEANGQLINIDVLGAMRRRKWTGGLIAFAGLAATGAAVIFWPPTYRSTATILIEEPDVPADLVKSTVSTFADDRLQVIQQRVMTNQNLNDIIDRFKLYQTALAEKPRSAVVDSLRSKILLEVVSADVSGQPANRQKKRNQATIAFTVSFDSGNPQVAQQVANRLTDLYLSENDRTRQEKAAGTTEFLTEQAQKLYADVQTLEKKLLDLKSTYNGSLPEQFNSNMQMLNQAQNQQMQTSSEIQVLQEKRSFLQNQLAIVTPYTVQTTNGRPNTPQGQLMDLELQYNDLSSKYGTKHPDVIRLQRQIEALKAQMGGGGGAAVATAEYAALQSQLADAQQRYGEQHPEVQRLRRKLAELQQQVGKPSAFTTLVAPQGPPDNPMYLQLQNQLGNVDSELRGAQERANSLDANVQNLQKRVLQTPAIESEYNALRDQYSAALQRYQSFKDKEADAEVAQNMEQQSKGETFSVIEPPELPDLPVSPNRKLLAAAGLVVSCMIAIGVALGLDMLDPRIYEPRSLKAVFGDEPLVAVPYLFTAAETRRHRRHVVAGLAATVVVIAGALYYVDVNVMPLDVIYASILNRYLS